jgi:replicative DNA helicase
MTVVPHSAAAERELLGSMLLDDSIADRALAAVDRDDLYLPQSQAVFEAIRLVRGRGFSASDSLMVHEAMVSAGTSGLFEGGAAALLELAAGVMVAALWEQQAAAIREKARLRRLALLCSEVIASAHTASDASEILEHLGAEVARLAMGASSKLVCAADVMGQVLAELEARAIARANGDTSGGGITFGVPSLDSIVCGMRPGQLVVVAAETSGGKTALAQQAGLLLALNGGCVLNFNLEMTSADLCERALSYLAKINSAKLRNGNLDLEAFHALHEAAAKSWGDRYYIEDRTFRPADIAAKARAWRAKHPGQKGLVIVDFLQLIDCPQAKGETRARAVGAVAQALKTLAKQLEVPVIAVSQLNRDALKDQRPPRKSDLRDSGEIENAADVIVFVHRTGSTEPSPDAAELPAPVQFIVAKNRNGRVLAAEGLWDQKHYAFVPLFNNGR